MDEHKFFATVFVVVYEPAVGISIHPQCGCGETFADAEAHALLLAQGYAKAVQSNPCGYFGGRVLDASWSETEAQRIASGKPALFGALYRAALLTD